MQRIHVFYPAECFEPHVNTVTDRTELLPNCDETAMFFFFSYYTISFECILLVNYLKLFREIDYRALIIR